MTKSRRALRAALLALMEERSFDEITVGDLCQAADVNRGTFYNHFRDKDDLLTQLEAEFMEDVESFRERMGQQSLVELSACVALRRPVPLLVDLFDYLRDQGPLLRAVLGPDGDERFVRQLQDALCNEVVRPILSEKYQGSDDPFVGYYIAFFASAYLGVIRRWIADGMRESSEEMALIAIRLLFIKPGEAIRL